MKTARFDGERGRGGTITLIVVVLVGVALVSATALVVTNGHSKAGEAGAEDEFVVKRGSFRITIPTSGELAALQQIEIRNRLEHRATITEIIEEGTSVKAGDVLFRIADEEIRNKIKDSEDAVNTANSASIAAQSNLDIRISSSKSELDRADLAVMLAELDLEAWDKGEVVKRRRQLALDLEIAQKDYSRLNEQYDQSVKLQAQKFISRDELKRDEIAMIRAHAYLKEAQLSKQVYENYQFPQDQARKISNLDQSRAERTRVEERHKAEMETVRANVASKRHQLRSRRERLTDLLEQLELCTVQAPADGWVVYASSLESGRWRHNNGQAPTVGTELRRNDLVIVLPDTSQMIASVKVNEALSGVIEPGLKATITSDAMPDEVLHGEVISIGVLAESGGWIDRNRRDYTVKILIWDGEGLGLKPSMRCKADIFVGRVDDTLFVPVQAVFREGALAYVYVRQESGFAQRAVTLGRSSELNVEVLEGLDAQEVVLLREPEPGEVVARLQDKPPVGEQTATDPLKNVWTRR